MKPFSEMTDAEIAEFIAKKMGYTLDKSLTWKPKNPDKNYWNPMHSLDQCKLILDWVKKNDFEFQYTQSLCNVLNLGHKISIFSYLNSTASQLCEAFLDFWRRRMNLFKFNERAALTMKREYLTHRNREQFVERQEAMNNEKSDLGMDSWFNSNLAQTFEVGE